MVCYVLVLLVIFFIYSGYSRPTKHSLPFTKFTNLISEWKVRWFFRLKKICTVSDLFLFSVF